MRDLNQLPEMKYNNDPSYRQLVDLLEQMIEHAQYTPSELREAAIYAAVIYEMRKPASVLYKEMKEAQR